MYKIDKGVQVPLPDGRGGGNAKYPWADMEPGDSFFVPLEGAAKFIRHMSAPPKLREAGMEYARRTVTENGVNGVRFWRVK